MTRLTRLVGLTMAAAILLAACGGSAPSPTPADAATAAPPTDAASVAPATAAPATDGASPDASGLDLSGAAAALESIEKYQIEITMSGFMPTAAGASEITMTGLVDQSADAYQFDMAGVEGLPGAAAFSLVVIGGDAWIDAGGTGFIKQPSGGAAFESLRTSFAPQSLLTQVPTAGLLFNKVGDESKNGVATGHYHVDAGDVPAFVAQLGEDAEMDIWIADDGGYLISMTLSGTQNGSPVAMSMDLSRINDPSISITEPN